MNREDLSLRNKLLIGLNLSYNQLLAKKQREDGNLIFSKNGKVIKIKARQVSQVELEKASV